jgi:alkanesulfonate monooxygenase SsuD/methylene tetrahydromethanopterin reductase-like flavin-dependent oxidoreductase (luciferase family)
MSDGRLLFGVGVGWNVEELANHRPIQWSHRYRALEECVVALRQLWTAEEAEHHGEFFEFDPVWSFPKPVQKPKLPVLLGVGGRLGTQHAARWADEWMPIDIALGNVAKQVGKFRQMVADAGRSPVPISLVAFGDPTLDTLLSYREIGIERVVLGANRTGWDDPSTTMAYIDRYAESIPALLS